MISNHMYCYFIAFVNVIQVKTPYVIEKHHILIVSMCVKMCSNSLNPLDLHKTVEQPIERCPERRSGCSATTPKEEVAHPRTTP